MKIFTLIGIVSILAVGCGTESKTKYEYWDISKFNMVENALENNEEIKLIYTSQGPEKKEFDFYIHVIVVSQKTGDTVNILTAVDNGFTMDNKDDIFNFFDQNSAATKLIQLETENLEDIKHIDDLNSIPSKKINKVARDPKYDHIADNNYPTVIGSIGILSKKGE